MPDLLSHFIIVFASEILDALNLILSACLNKSLKVDWAPWSLNYLSCMSVIPMCERENWSFICIRMTVRDRNYIVLDMFPTLGILVSLMSVIPLFSRRTLY